MKNDVRVSLVEFYHLFVLGKPIFHLKRKTNSISVMIYTRNRTFFIPCLFEKEGYIGNWMKRYIAGYSVSTSLNWGGGEVLASFLFININPTRLQYTWFLQDSKNAEHFHMMSRPPCYCPKPLVTFLSTGSEHFSPLIYLNATKFVLISIFTLIKGRFDKSFV